MRRHARRPSYGSYGDPGQPVRSRFHSPIVHAARYCAGLLWTRESVVGEFSLGHFDPVVEVVGRLE
ncbi:hypothetical protein GCM10010302_10450 [Streptomyces polychromogenes]|uniref:Uncharacterized protein n=1 Tax=Streptomyces polychromogenes TaxID=67342 RepID=A0ABN0V4L9_9ACTN